MFLANRSDRTEGAGRGWRVTGVLGIAVLLASTVLAVGACQGAPTSPSAAESLQDAVVEAYRREFGLEVPTPAIYDDRRAVSCSGASHVTTTAYLNRSGRTGELFFMYLSRDGATVRRTSQETVVLPAGPFRVLAVIVRHGDTVDDAALADWYVAEQRVNDDHADFATSRGYPEPLVRFETTGVLVDPETVFDARLREPVRLAASRAGVSPAGFDFTMSINMDPARVEGGFATTGPTGGGFIYMGNFEGWTSPLTADDWRLVAYAAYHHEVGHHWGWPGTHDWSPRCGPIRLGFEPLIAAPILFGWEDVDGDGVPEILDPTPYGRSGG